MSKRDDSSLVERDFREQNSLLNGNSGFASYALLSGIIGASLFVHAFLSGLDASTVLSFTPVLYFILDDSESADCLPARVSLLYFSPTRIIDLITSLYLTLN